MKGIIETSKGRFVVMDVDYNQLCFVRIGLKATAMYNSIELFDYDESYKLSEITEEQASCIVDYPIILEEIQGGDKMYTYYNYKLGRYDYGTSLVDSLESLLKSHNIEITNNTYIFKV